MGESSKCAIVVESMQLNTKVSLVILAVSFQFEERDFAYALGVIPVTVLNTRWK